MQVSINLTKGYRADGQHYSIEHGARNVHPQRIQAFMDNLRPQDETFGGQRFSRARGAEKNSLRGMNSRL